MIRNKYVLLAVRIMVGGLFVWTGLLKVVDPLGFAQTISNFRLVSREMSFAVALILPWIEVISGSLLIAGIFRRSSALLISVLLLGFIGLTLVTMARGIDADCGCFGNLSRKVDVRLILEDGLLCLLSLTLFFSRTDTIVLLKSRSPEPSI
ncbi:MAG: MauE/DoxX family redox-associated membrane protein [Candidatus Aminicenantales bacterium]